MSVITEQQINDANTLFELAKLKKHAPTQTIASPHTFLHENQRTQIHGKHFT